MAVAVKLTYLPIAARGFPIRFCLRAAGVAFTDERLPRESLHSGRGPAGYSPAFPLGQLPVLAVGEELFTESLALSRWAARQGASPLYPPGAGLDTLLCDEVCAIIDELWSKVPMARHHGLGEPEALAAARAHFVASVAPRFLERLAARAARGGPFFLGAAPSLADVWLCALAAQVESGAYTPGVPVDLVAAHAPLAANVAAFRAHPLFKEHGEPM
jgi:glutathione S-transferase